MTLPSRVGLGLVAGALLAAGFPPYCAPALLPFGVALLLVAVRGATLREAFYSGLACGAIYFGATLFWLWRIFAQAAVPLCALLAAFMALFGTAFACVSRRVDAVPGALLAAVLWTGIEFYRSELFVLRFGWMGLGYALVGYPGVGTLASWLGSYGLSFVLVLAGAAISIGFDERRRNHAAAAACAGLWLTACAVSYVVSLTHHAEPRRDRPLSVRLVQAESGDEDTLFALSQRPDGNRVDAVVWPEYSFLRDPRDVPQLWRRLQSLARRARACFVFGGEIHVDRFRTNAYRNTAFVLGPDGSLLGTHVKNHTVHFFDDGIPGKDARAIATPAARLGVAICFDMDYPDVAARLADDGAEALLVPSLDPSSWGPVQREQHRLMFEMRAAECGRWLVRADAYGGTGAVSPDGREIARVRDSEPTALDVTIGLEAGRTVYLRLGRWIGPLCLWASVSICLLSALPRRFSQALRRRNDDKRPTSAT